MTPAARPRFSIILPTHDRLEMLQEAVVSVARQSFQDWELIVVDDASKQPPDPTELSRWAGRDVRLDKVSTPSGGAHAKSVGAAAARGEVLAFLDDDDLWDPAYLERANQAMLAQPEVRVLFMGVQWFGERGKSGQESQERGMAIILEQTGAKPDSQGVIRFHQDALFTALLQRVPMPFQRPLAHREDYLAIGGYRPECLLWDCDWALRAVLHGECALLDRGLYLQRAAGQGYSSQGRRALEHARSGLEIKESLLRHPAVRGRPERLTRVREALHRDWKSYAWQLAERGEHRESNAALRTAARYGLSLEWVKMRLRAMMGKPRS